MGRLGLSLLVLLAGCEPDPGDSDAHTGDTEVEGFELADLTGGCDTDLRVGGFELAHWDGPDEGFATATGAVTDAVIPSTIRFESGREGGCVLWQKVVPYCEEVCEADQACDHDGECVPYPVPQDLGSVSFSGLTAPLELTADEFGNYWDTSLSYPLFEAGSPIVASAGSLLELRGFGVEPLVVPEPLFELVPGEDMPISWTAGTAPAWVEFTFNIDQHGLSPLTMICQLEDTGTASLPSGLLEQLVNSGVSGYPSAWMRRRTADAVQLEQGCVDLQVYSHVAVAMGVQGYTPCSGDQDCPDEQHCDMDQQICVDD
jgi:hypothetical protein